MSDDYRADLVNYPPEEILDYTIQELAESENIYFYLPYQWADSDGLDNPRPEDPLTIYWTADVSGGDHRITYKTTISVLLNDTFEIHELAHEDPPAIGVSSVPLFVDIRDALQKEVDRLNLWINNAKQDGEKI
jgi:hypothetical protein